MLEAYILRKRWEADLLAVAVVTRLGEAMGGGSATPERPRQKRDGEPGKHDRVSSDTFLRMMGIRLDGNKPS